VTNGRPPAPDDALGIVSCPAGVGVDQVLRRVLEHLDDLGLEVFAVIDHSGEAAKVGLTMPDTKLVVFGNPKGGTPLMVAHPLIALDLPLKLLIWETADNDVFVSYNTPDYLAERYRLSRPETDAARIVEAIARSAVSD
jgi:uncharacterized protein (DUF302 family)